MPFLDPIRPRLHAFNLPTSSQPFTLSTPYRLVPFTIAQAVPSAPASTPPEPISTAHHRPVASPGRQAGNGMKIRLGAARLLRLGRLAGRVSGVEIDGFGVAVGGGRLLGLAVGVGPVGRRGVFARRRLSGPGRGGGCRAGAQRPMGGGGGGGFDRRRGFLAFLLGRRLEGIQPSLRRGRKVGGLGELRRLAGAFQASQIMAVGCVCLCIQPTHTSGFFMAVGPHVAIGVVLVSPRRPSFFGCMRDLLDEGLLIAILRNVRDNTTPAEFRGFGRIAQGCTIRAFAAQHCRFVFLPVTLAEPKASVLGPEEEPDAAQDKAGGEKRKQREDTAVVDVVRVKAARTRWVLGGWRSGRAGTKIRVRLERGQNRRTLGYERYR